MDWAAERTKHKTHTTSVSDSNSYLYKPPTLKKDCTDSLHTKHCLAMSEHFRMITVDMRQTIWTKQSDYGKLKK